MQVFPQDEAQIHLEWPISPHSQLFPSFANKASHFSRNLKKFSFLEGGVHWQFFECSTFLIPFTQEQLKMTHNGEFCQKIGLDWLKMANFGHFGGFTKMRLRFTQNGQFHPIHNFSHLLPTKHIIFQSWGGYIKKV